VRRLKAEEWDKIGWKKRQGVEDRRSFLHYPRPTIDGRILTGFHFRTADVHGAWIGKKTAQRVVLELKEKLGTMDEPTPIAGKPHAVARDALVELGWSVTEAEEALAATDPSLTPEERVRQALRAA